MVIVVLEYLVSLVADIAASGVTGKDEFGVVVKLVELRSDKVNVEFHNSLPQEFF
jgi:hypothetical protein